MQEEKAPGVTRRGLLLAGLGCIVGLVVGGAVGSRAFPKIVEKVVTTTATETLTKTLRETVTVTETVTVGVSPTPSPTTSFVQLPEELKNTFKGLLSGAELFEAIHVEDEVAMYKAYSTDAKPIGYVFKVKVYAPTDRLIVYGAISLDYKVMAIDVVQAPDAMHVYNPKILTPEFEDQFKGLTLEDLALKPVGKVTAVTGATLSSRAVTEGIKDIIETLMSKA